jgi:hypothetical protein
MCPVIVGSLRWLHASLVCNELAELESNLSVVGGSGNDSCGVVSELFRRQNNVISMGANLSMPLSLLP